MRRYRVSRAADVARDLNPIEEHVFQLYQEFGDDLETAIARAAARIDEALVYMRAFTVHPHRGTEHKKIGTGIRTVSNKSFVFYFEIDEQGSEVRILVIFFGGADHRRQLLDRFRH